MMTDFISWARLRRVKDPFFYFANFYIDARYGRPCYIAESGIYTGEFNNWRRESSVRINNPDNGLDYLQAMDKYETYVRPIVDGTATVRDMIHAYQEHQARAYFSTVKD